MGAFSPHGYQRYSHASYSFRCNTCACPYSFSVIEQELIVYEQIVNKLGNHGICSNCGNHLGEEVSRYVVRHNRQVEHNRNFTNSNINGSVSNSIIASTGTINISSGSFTISDSACPSISIQKPIYESSNKEQLNKKLLLL